jgi:hypothetical protein
VFDFRREGDAMATDMVRRRAYRRNRYHNDPVYRAKQLARIAVTTAVNGGKLVKLPCEICGDPKSQGHHDDYSMPLDVVWLCQAHHRERHACQPPASSGGTLF